MGGGGNDTLWGGGDTDWLEGQNGNDTLYGGAGIDVMVMDVRDTYTVFGDNIDGHYGNVVKGDVRDDNATDILLIEASDGDDKVLLSEDVVLFSNNNLPTTALNFDDTFTLTLTGIGLPSGGISATMTVHVGGGTLDTLVGNINDAPYAPEAAG